MTFVRDRLDIEDISAIFVCGGDGTIHEVINGMLLRPDKRQVPLGLFPTGSGNDTCCSFEIRSIDDAVSCVEAGDLLPTDICRILIDKETEDEALEEFRKTD